MTDPEDEDDGARGAGGVDVTRGRCSGATDEPTLERDDPPLRRADWRRESRRDSVVDVLDGALFDRELVEKLNSCGMVTPRGAADGGAGRGARAALLSWSCVRRAFARDASVALTSGGARQWARKGSR